MLKKKRWLLAGIIALAAIALLVLVLLLVKNGRSKQINVYAVSDFSMDQYWGSESETYGAVYLDKIQTVYISDTQKISEVYVKEGQTVKAGDKLLAYDTTLTDIALQKAQITLEKSKAQLESAKRELQKLNTLTPHSSVLVTPNNPQPVLTPQTTPKRISGSGTEDDPYYYLWGASDRFDDAFFSSLFGGADGQIPDGEVYAVFMIRQSNAINGKIELSWGMHLQAGGGQVSWSMFQATIPDNLQPAEQPNNEPYYVDSGSDYTAAELAQMRKDKAKEISDLTLQIKIAEVDLREKQQEVTNGVVVSTVDGVVKNVLDPDEAYRDNKPVVTVSGGGGYYVKGAVSELEMGDVQPGQTVTVRSMESDMSYEGEVVSVSDYPTTENNSWTNGNSNVSFYPLTVFIDESAELRENEYVDITFSAGGGESKGFFLENQFLLAENGQHYVYMRNEKGKLERRQVQTGRSADGYCTQILGGLTQDDWVAFPYLSTIREGASTREATMDDFYNS